MISAAVALGGGPVITMTAALEIVRTGAVGVFLDVGCCGGGFFLAMIFFARLGGVLSESSLDVEGGDWCGLPFASLVSRCLLR